MKAPHHLLATLKRSVEEFNLVRAEGEALDFSGADLNCARLSGAALSGVNLSGANLRSADLDGADLRGANVSGANLIRASLVNARLYRASLVDADLTDADLTRVRADGADFQRVALTRASLRRASLRRVNLAQAKMGDADLSNADLYGAYAVEVDFSYVKVEGIRRDEIRLGFWITEVPEVDHIALEHGAEGLSVAGQAGPYVLAASARGDYEWEVRVEHLGLLPDAFRFIDQTQLRGLKKLFSGEDVILGDVPLDDATHIEGSPAQLSARLDVEARASLLAWIRDGGLIEDGVLRCAVPRDHLRPLLLRRVELIPYFQRACRIAHALSRPLTVAQLTDALLAQARTDPLPAVRHRALARYVGRRAKDARHAFNWADRTGLFPGVSLEDSEGACILLLDADDSWLQWSAARWLGEFGTVLALKRLLEVANGTFVDRMLRDAAQDAAEAILGRNGGDGAGRLSVLDTGAEGAVSFPDSDD